jgi:hypothetical protein
MMVDMDRIAGKVDVMLVRNVKELAVKEFHPHCQRIFPQLSTNI